CGLLFVTLFNVSNISGRRLVCFFFSSRRRHTRFSRDWSSDVCSSDLLCRYIQYNNSRRHVMRKRVKLEDIAKVVGISKMAVSLALRDHPSISEKTTKNVKKVAEKLGYVPNRLAQSLVKVKSNTLAMLMSGTLHDDYQNQILRGAIPYAMSRGYTIFVGPMAQPQLESMYIEKYKNMMVDGFLGFHSITDNRINSENYQKLKDEGIPFVLYTKYFPDMETDYVVCNDFLGGYMMTKHLIELGHKEIGFV